MTRAAGSPMRACQNGESVPATLQDEVGALQRHHILVRQPGELARLEQRIEFHRRQALGFDHAHVPAAALYAKHIPFVADQVRHPELDGGVAAAVKDEARLAAQKPSRVDAQCQFARNALFA